MRPSATIKAFLAKALGAERANDARLGERLGDASTRYYHRLILPQSEGSSGKPAKRQTPTLLMVSPNPQDKLPFFLYLAKKLRDAGFRAPAIYATDEAAGLALIEDFGPNSFSTLLAQGVEEEPLYHLAVHSLCALQKARLIDQPDFQDWPRYGPQEALREVNLYLDWYIPKFHPQRSLNKMLRKEWEEIWQNAYANAHQSPLPANLVLRDFHSDNLMFLGKGPSHPQQHQDLGLLDFQDALIGSPCYDLVSLLEDARRDLSQNLRDQLLKAYADQFPNLSKAQIAKEARFWALQRHFKVLGIFVRLAERDHKAHYLAHLPRLQRLINNHLKHKDFLDLSNWLSAHID